MAIQFHESEYGKTFFQHQLPELIKSLKRIADTLEENNRQISESTIETESSIHPTELHHQGEDQKSIDSYTPWD